MISIRYPHVKWSCKLCGDCCRDMPNRERRIRLTEGDVLRIRKQGINTDFYRREKKGAEPYNYKMVKKEGGCIFLMGNRCTIYENRPLVCQFYPLTLIKLNDYLFDLDRTCRGVGTGKILRKNTLKRLVLEAQRALTLPQNKTDRLHIFDKMNQQLT